VGKPNKEGRLKLKDLQPFLGKAKLGNNMPYYNRAGELKTKPGYSVLNLENWSPVLSGGGGFYDNHWIYDQERGYIRPLTMRERLAIQGFGTDFTLSHGSFDYGGKIHQALIKQTGKCMPVEFATEFARQIIKGNKGLKESRVDPVPPIVLEAKNIS
jgi:site-specific DNA-cytosine methylase